MKVGVSDTVRGASTATVNYCLGERREAARLDRNTWEDGPMGKSW